ncbi:MAG TPA: tRNA (adenosine(37)-N6)-threonylcarbamoyltransferase complex dimerization subunit type 1 TsaB [Gaiellaceae bacterium]
MLILAFDTATDVATSALVSDGEVLGERTSRAVTVLEDIDALLRQAGAHTRELDGIAVGIGPGSFTGIRIGLATARGLALALGVPVAGVSTLDALAAGAPLALPVIDARRGEVFVLQGEPRVLVPAGL